MKVLSILVIALCAWSAMSTVEQLLLISDALEGMVKDDNGWIPSSFEVNATFRDAAQNEGNAVFRFSDPYNIMAYNLTHYNSTYKKNVTDAVAYDFNRNRTYVYSYAERRCYNSTSKYSFNYNIVTFMNMAWDYYAKIIDERYIGGHKQTTYEVPIDSQNDYYLTTTDDKLNSTYGYVFGNYRFHNFTSQMVSKPFTENQLIPKECKR